MQGSRFFLCFSIALAVGAAVVACVGDDPTVASSSEESDGGDASTDSSVSNNDGAITDGGTVDSGPLHFCQTETAPIDAADFFCADFDESTDVTTGFTSVLADSGTLVTTTDVAFSLPNSLSSTAQSSLSEQYAFLSWTKAGATALQTVTVSAEVNPFDTENTGAPATGNMYLLEIQVANARVEWAYAHGASTFDAGTYTGYVLHIIGGGGTFQVGYGVPVIPPNLFTKVSLSYNLATGGVALAYEGTTVATTSVSGASTTVTAVVGCDSAGTTAGGTWRFDNFEVATTRSP
jgi:hypothetical protein